MDAGAMILLPEYAGFGGGRGERRSSTQRAVVVIL